MKAALTQLAVLSALLMVLTTGLTLLTGDLVGLTVAALCARTAGPPAGPGTRRFAIVIPAHNEEALIGRLLPRLSQLDYPGARF